MTSVTSSSAKSDSRRSATKLEKIVALVLAVAFITIGGWNLSKSLSASSARQALVEALNRYRVSLGPDGRRILTDYLKTNYNVDEFVLGQPLLDIATECGYPDIVADLLRQGANPNLRGDGWAPLYTACNEDKYVIAVELIKGGADVNESNGRGWTPLLTATWGSKNPELIKSLIAAGASVNAAAPDGETPLDIALQRTDPAGKTIAGIIEAAGGRTHKYQPRR